MPSDNNMQNMPGLYVPTTNIWNIDLETADLRELVVRLYQYINNISLSLNISDKGYYVLEEFVTGQQFFANPTLTSATRNQPVFRPTFRKVINFGLLVNGTKSVAHGLTIPNPNQYTFTRIYGTANDQTNRSYIPLPYASATGDNIEVEVDATNINITTNSATWVTYSAIIVIEWMRT